MEKFNLNEVVKYAEAIKQTKKQVLSGNVEPKDYHRIIGFLVSSQKTDGAWTCITDYRIDADCRVAYVYETTYDACCILIYLDNRLAFAKNSEEAIALEKGLQFATGRGLYGHGYESTSSKMMAMNEFENAGIYAWFKKHPDGAVSFREMWEQSIDSMREALEEGKTYADWNVDFKNDMSERVSRYEEQYLAYENVWYACYGSNTCKERFMEYISQCANTTPPEESRPYEFPHPIYFGGNSVRWGNKGTAFLNTEQLGHSYGRIYKVTYEQFETVRKKEGSKYSKKVFLGYIDNLPVYTFTCETQYKVSAVPAQEYLDVIHRGLKETYPELSTEYLSGYLVNTIFSEIEYKVLRTIRKNAHYMTNREISEKLLRDLGVVSSSTEHLCGMKLIRKDRRCSFEINHADAGFFTIESERDFIDRIIVIKEKDKNQSLYEEKIAESEINDLLLEDVPSSFAFRGMAKPKSPASYNNGRRVFPRDRKVSANALSHANFVCELDPEHPTFMRRNSDKPYTEPHHLVPLSESDRFQVSLDVEENIVSLCSNCHNLLHYGQGAEELLKKLYMERREALEQVGISITFEELLEMYSL